jgi:hypothetical protein
MTTNHLSHCVQLTSPGWVAAYLLSHFFHMVTNVWGLLPVQVAALGQQILPAIDWGPTVTFGFQKISAIYYHQLTSTNKICGNSYVMLRR